MVGRDELGVGMLEVLLLPFLVLTPSLDVGHDRVERDGVVVVVLVGGGGGAGEGEGGAELETAVALA